MSVAVSCEACGATDVERDESVGLACCRVCEAVFPLPVAEDVLDTPVIDDALAVMFDVGVPTIEVASRLPSDVMQPSQFVERTKGDELVVEWSWFSYSGVPVLLFALVWNGALVKFYVDLLSGTNLTVGICAVLFSVVHVAAGAGLVYYGLALLINRTLVRVDRRGLQVRHAPLPWMGARDVVVADIQQLYVLKREVRHDDRVTYLYDLRAVLVGNDDVPVFQGFSEHSEARFLEAKIEHWLRIEDRPVFGEHKPTATQG